MKCFNHPDADAIGICKNCNKGLCKDCFTEVENGIACTASCIDEVKQINSIINRGRQSYKVTSGAHMRNAYMLGGIGIAFIIFGLTIKGLSVFLSIMGLIFIFGAWLSIISAMKYKKMK